MVEIKHKRSKLSLNPRAARLRETSYIYAAMQQVIQVKHEIERVATETETSIVDLKPTAIQTHLLWNILDEYLRAYNMLLKENLIKTGNIHKIQPTIN
jgi:hypothetical protein